MNNREAFAHLEKQSPYLDLKCIYHGVNADPSYTFQNLHSYRNAFNKLLKLNLLPATDLTISKLRLILNTDEEETITGFTEGYDIEKASSVLHQATGGLLRYIHDKLIDVKENTIDVKLVKIADLEELEKTANLLKRSFSIPIYELDAKVEVSSLENGSAWIILGIVGGTGAAIRLCANLIWAAAVIHKKQEDAKNNAEYLKSSNIDLIIIDQVNEQITRNIEYAKEGEALSMHDDYFPESDSESIQRLKTAIESIGTLIEKGVEFYPSVQASEEIKSLFPDFKLLNLIEAKTKLIDSGENKN
jgi:hypothetical protein